MTKTSDIIKKLPGVKVHKSIKDAMAAVSEEMEQKHLAVVKSEQKRRK